MVRVPDRTEVAPVRRMAVARGTLKLAEHGLARLKADASPMSGAKAAALLAAKDQARLVPTALPVQLTDAFCDIAVEGKHAVVTVTVQGHSRVVLEGPALAGVAAGLLSLLDALGGSEGCGGAIADVHVVQNVVA